MAATSVWHCACDGCKKGNGRSSREAVGGAIASSDEGDGVDVAAPRGSTITAAANGVVALTHPDMFFTGKTVMIDHGHGLSSVYVHMDDILVADGQRVKKGTPIGIVGKTGRVTGPHLHWGVSLFGTHLDPALLAAQMEGVR